MSWSRSAVRALWLLAVLAGVADVRAEEVIVGRGTSTSRSSTDWKGYFNSDMKKLTTNAETITTIDKQSSPPVVVNGVPFDLARTSPIRSTSVARTVALPTDPDFGTVEVQTTSVDALGKETPTTFVLRDKSLMAPIVVGPMDGAIVRTPPRDETIDGKTFAISSSSRTIEVVALIVAPSFEDLLASRNLREVSEPGTSIEKGTMRVLSPTGEAIGFYAGDVRRADVVHFVAPR